MATINYKCDTCNREIELLENKFGLTTFTRCTITKKCRGNLYKAKRNANNIRENLPKHAARLDDYAKRSVFYAHSQVIESSTWNVKHNFGNSCIFIVYDESNTIIDQDDYTVTTASPGVSIIKFTTKRMGTVHVLSRTGAAVVTNSTSNVFDYQVSYNDVLTFAIPKYITRINSKALPIVLPSPFPVTPPVSPTPLPTQPASDSPNVSLYTPCNKNIRIEIEVIRPNEPTVTCVETLDSNISSDSTWFGWGEVLIRNRKHYCLRTKKISELRVFSNTNNQKVNIPDGTQLRITRIDYGSGVLEDMQNIPDRGLLILFSKSPYKLTDKVLDELLDCGEMVGITNEVFSFIGNDLYVNSKLVEASYPKIVKYSGPQAPTISPSAPTPTPSATIAITPTSTPVVTPVVTPTPGCTSSKRSVPPVAAS